ncbi:MAG: hypothetical protein RMJ52_18740 [Gemmataceae bacterium]|nr:hypothetical protein [Gemmataceae bacterium]
MTLFRGLSLAAALVCCAGAGNVQADSPTIACPAAPLVFVADGAGNFQMTSKALKHAVAEYQLPLVVETFCWSLGKYRVIADTLNRDNAREKGRQLAQVVIERRRAGFAGPIYLIGHCAGCVVILAAAEHLPPASVTRIILLQPSSHSLHDLRPALRAASEGIDSFYSLRDTFCLGLGIRVGACLGNKCNPAAGRVGFQPVVESAEDVALYSKLRQYPWVPSLKSLGHNGGHFGCYQRDYLMNFVVPLMCEVPWPVAEQPSRRLIPGPAR